MDGLTILAQTSTDGAGAGASLIWIVGFIAYLAGTVQYFRGNHIGLGWVSVFIPFVFIGGFFIQPKPGSSRYMNLDATKKATADLRWPMQAKAFHDLMGDRDPKVVQLTTPVTPITQVVPPLPAPSEDE
jgi:hypothetical protein